MKTQIKPSTEWGKNRKREARERNLNATDRKMAIKDQQD